MLLAANKKLVAGLGNPGFRYRHTRHNIGFLVLQKNVLPFFKLKDKKTKSGDLAVSKTVGDREFHFLMPQTYMNLSGKGIAAYMEKNGIPQENLLVVSDDLDLPLGKIRFRTKGSSGGHNGLESIIGSLGSDQFNRLRVGIGRPETHRIPKDHVLEKFKFGERKTLEAVLCRVGDAVRIWLAEGPQAVNDFLSRS